MGRVKSVTNILGNITSYRYDLQQTAGHNNTPLPPGNRAVTRIDEITLPDNTLNNSTDNPKVTNKYDGANNFIAQISSTGLETRYVYDDLHPLTETILSDKTPSDWTDNRRTKTQYSETCRIIWNTPEAGTHKMRVRVEDGRGGVNIQ